MSTSLNNRQRAFLMITLLMGEDDSADLIRFLPQEEEEVTSGALRRLLAKSAPQKKQIIKDELMRIMREAEGFSLADIHPDWIAKKLEGENSRVIATILRYLPGEMVKAVLEKLPEEVLQTLPTLTETFSVDPTLASILKKRFEENFISSHLLSTPSKELTFETLHLLSPLKLRLLFCELGMREIALALSTLNQETVNLILQRMAPLEALNLKKRLTKPPSVTKERLNQAQAHLVSLDLGKKESAGFFVYSKAILAENIFLADLIMQRFPMETALLLKHYLDKNLPLNSMTSALRYQKEIREAARVLGEED